MATPVLFSRIERSDRSYSRLSESTFQFLDRVAGPFWDRVRDLIEDWLAVYPASDRGELVSRLRDDSGSFRSAYWELYLVALVHAHGGTVICHPSVPGTSKRPDFGVEGLGEPFYVEATVLEEGGVAGDRNRRRNEIWEGLNERVRSEHFWVTFAVEQFSPSALPIRRFAKSVDRWLRSLDPAVVSDSEDDRFEHRWDDPSTGWRILLRPIRKARPSLDDRLVFAGDGESGFFNDREALRTKVNDKYRRYGAKFDRPLVIAVAGQRIGVDDWDVNQALFGDEVLIVERANPRNKRPVRARNGVWFGSKGPRSTRLSAVLSATANAPSGVAESRLVQWLNPWADKPWSPVFSNSDTVGPVDDRLVRTEARQTSRQCFNLAKDWPGPEPAFRRQLVRSARRMPGRARPRARRRYGILGGVAAGERPTRATRLSIRTRASSRPSPRRCRDRGTRPPSRGRGASPPAGRRRALPAGCSRRR